MRLKTFLVSILVMAPILIGQTGSARDAIGQQYFPDCGDVLESSTSSASRELVRKLVQSVKYEGQALQLLYDGGLIFSDLYSRALIYTIYMNERANVSPSTLFSVDLRGTISINDLANKIEEILMFNDQKFAQFAWRVIENEKAILINNQKSNADEVRLRQVFRVASELQIQSRASDSYIATQNVLRDVVTASLRSMMRNVFVSRAEKWRTRSAKKMLSWFELGLMVTLPDFKHLNPYQGALWAYAGYRLGSSISADFMADRYDKKARAIVPVAYFLSTGSRMERVELADVLSQFASDPQMSLSVNELSAQKLQELNRIQMAYVGEIDLVQLDAEYETLFRRRYSIDHGAAAQLAKQIQARAFILSQTLSSVRRDIQDATSADDGQSKVRVLLKRIDIVLAELKRMGEKSAAFATQSEMKAKAAEDAANSKSDAVSSEWADGATGS